MYKLKMTDHVEEAISEEQQLTGTNLNQMCGDCLLKITKNLLHAAKGPLYVRS